MEGAELGGVLEDGGGFGGHDDGGYQFSSMGEEVRWLSAPWYLAKLVFCYGFCALHASYRFGFVCACYCWINTG